MVITFLTGSRPELLETTLKSVFEMMPLLKDETLMALCNGGDKPTQEVLEKYGIPFMKTKELLPIGPAISLLAEYAEKTKERYWLHIEDDWKAVNGMSGINKAIFILETFVSITQVRLRHISEKVMDHHMITGVPIKWLRGKDFNYGKAHMTFNPNIMRTSDISKAYPCSGERDAQKKWLSNNYVAQLDPGIFKHIGGDNSLRLKTKAEV